MDLFKYFIKVFLLVLIIVFLITKTILIIPPIILIILLFVYSKKKDRRLFYVWLFMIILLEFLFIILLLSHEHGYYSPISSNKANMLRLQNIVEIFNLDNNRYPKDINEIKSYSLKNHKNRWKEIKYPCRLENNQKRLIKIIQLKNKVNKDDTHFKEKDFVPKCSIAYFYDKVEKNYYIYGTTANDNEIIKEKNEILVLNGE
ncbi:MAG: hypothetical protein U0354_05555 [Candidatus Sericytochromatia bacterium]